jgi:hypothetical protein
MFSSMTAGLSKNIMQANIEKIKETKQIFEEIETAINILAYKQKDSAGRAVIDLSNSDFTDLDGTFLAQHMSYTKKQIDKDPWEKKVKLFRVVEHVKVWGAPGGLSADAPISTIMLVSSGPNGKYDTLESLGLPQSATTMSASDIKTTDITDPDVIGDDIVSRFNNYDAMLDIWEKSEELDNSIKNIALDYYRVRLDAFSPLIQLAERDVNSGGALSTGVFDDLTSTANYTGFDQLTNDKDAFSTSWNNKGTQINNLLRIFETAKTYDNDFRLSSDNTENTELNKDFKDKYSGRLFLYPSFSAVEKDKNGNVLPTVKQGLQNLGISNMSSLDPFSGNNEQVDYVYDDDEPHIIKIVRKSSGTNVEKWKINKVLTVDGLGEVK